MATGCLHSLRRPSLAVWTTKDTDQDGVDDEDGPTACEDWHSWNVASYSMDTDHVGPRPGPKVGERKISNPHHGVVILRGDRDLSFSDDVGPTGENGGILWFVIRQADGRAHARAI